MKSKYLQYRFKSFSPKQYRTPINATGYIKAEDKQEVCKRCGYIRREHKKEFCFVGGMYVENLKQLVDEVVIKDEA